MKAVRYYAQGDVRVEEVEKPILAKGGLLVKVDACAVCGTDLKSFNSGNPRLNPPIVMGHEFTGIVKESDSSLYKIGDRVVMATSISCGECAYCKAGYSNLCSSLAPMGFSYDGGMAEWVAIPERAVRNGHVIIVPEGVSAKAASLAEPLSCAVNSIENAKVKKGDTVVVVGAGPMGILNGLVAISVGAKKVIMAEVNPERLAQTDGFGFTLVDSSSCSLKEVVMSQTDGIGADVVIVAAPAAQPQQQALELVRKRGTVALFASLPLGKSILEMDSRLIHYNELTVTGSSDSTPAHVAKAVEILSSKSFPSDKIANYTLPLDGIFEAFELMKSGRALRVVLTT